MQQWEITYVRAQVNNVPGMIEAANKLGAEGWEPIGVTSADKTIGLNSMLLVFKRPIIDSPPPPANPDEWQADPTGRYDKRRWNGKVWTAETAMMEAKTLHIDPPTI